MAEKFDWVRRRWHLVIRWWPTRITVTGLVFGCLTFIAFAWTSLASSLREALPNMPLIVASVASFLAAAWLKWSDKLVTGKNQRKQRRNKRRNINLSAARLLLDLPRVMKSNISEDARQSHRESTLRCIKMIVSDLIDEVGTDRLMVSLLDFSGGSTEEMRVVARSDKTRGIGNSYRSSGSLAFQSIQTGVPEVVDDIRHDDRWANIGKRRYRSVMAVPLTRGDFALGALCIDSERPYDFLGLVEEIAVFIMPYLVGLALTYPKNAVCVQCRYDSSHLQ